MSKKYLLFFTGLFLFSFSASAETMRFVSKEVQTNLVELYTSEGCSSCPPADRWLSKLKNSEQLWKGFVPLAFHVDYWDYIGWKDRFASPIYGARQRQYAKHKGISNVYTPGIVLDGKEWRDWYRYKQPGKSNRRNVGQLQLVLDQNIVDGQFETVAKTSSENLNLHIALLGFNQTTEVKAGENADRSLRHDFVVLAYKVAELKYLQNIYRIKTELPVTRVKSKTRAIAAWVSARDHPKPIQAVGGWLP